MEFFFCMQIKIKVGIIATDGSIQNKKLIIFLQYIKKKVLQLLLCSIKTQNIQIFYGSPVMFVVANFFCFNFRVQHNSASEITCTQNYKSNRHINLCTENSAIDDKNDADHPKENFEYWNIPRDKGELSDSAEKVTPHSSVLREVIKDALWLK